VGLSKANRLKDRRDFQTVYRRGLRCGSAHLILRGLIIQNNDDRNNALISTRVGISISKKVSKKAVIRNRIKRQIRAALRELLPKMDGIWQIVIVVKVGATECKYEHFLRELKQLFKKAEAINGN
jgi:ribonuclease P protein component